MSSAITMGNAALDAGYWRGPQRSDADMREQLENAHRIAVVGAKPEPENDAHRIPLYLQAADYEVVGVNPRLSSAAPFEAAATLADVEGSVDLINIFRAPEHVPAHTDEILALATLPKTVWLQLGIVCGRSAARLRAAGIRVIQDRCIMVEHRRLLA